MPLIARPRLTDEFLSLRPALYHAYTGGRKPVWVVAIPDARSSTAWEEHHFACRNWPEALRHMNAEIKARREPGHPWNKAEHARNNWLVWEEGEMAGEVFVTRRERAETERVNALMASHKMEPGENWRRPDLDSAVVGVAHLAGDMALCYSVARVLDALMSTRGISRVDAREAFRIELRLTEDPSMPGPCLLYDEPWPGAGLRTAGLPAQPGDWKVGRR